MDAARSGVISLAVAMVLAAGGCAHRSAFWVPEADLDLAEREAPPQSDGVQLVSAEETLDDVKPSFYESRVKTRVPRNVRSSRVGGWIFGKETEESRQRSEQAARYYIREGEKHFAAKEYEDAAQQYEIAARVSPSSYQREDAMYMVAESWFFADKYPAAEKAYVELLKKYENSRYLDKVVVRQYAIARYWQARGKDEKFFGFNPTDETRPWFRTSTNALAVYDVIRLHDPTGPLADDAIMLTAGDHLENGRIEQADYYYDILRKEHPQSEHQADAHFLGARTKMEMYQGPEYEAQPLLDCEQLLEQCKLQFPFELQNRREDVDRMAKTVVALKAEREWFLAEYYTTKKFYGASRQYLENILKDYPDTPFAEMAQQSLAELEGKPDVPEDRVPWLTKHFSRNKDR